MVLNSLGIVCRWEILRDAGIFFAGYVVAPRNIDASWGKRLKCGIWVRPENGVFRPGDKHADKVCASMGSVGSSR